MSSLTGLYLAQLSLKFKEVMILSQTQKQAPNPQKRDSKPSKPESLKEKGDKLKEEMDTLIEEIDEVLEEDCQTFIANYIQRGGQ